MPANQVTAECGHLSGWWGEDTDRNHNLTIVSTGATGFAKDLVAFVLLVEAGKQFPQTLFRDGSFGLLAPASNHCRTFFRGSVCVTELRISISRLLVSAVRTDVV